MEDEFYISNIKIPNIKIDPIVIDGYVSTPEEIAEAVEVGILESIKNNQEIHKTILEITK